jgi:hypothetical protein
MPESGGHPNLFVMKATNALERDHPPLLWRLNRPPVQRQLTK